MFEIEVSGVKKLDRFAKMHFAERAVAFEYALTRIVVEQIFEEIQNGISDTTQEEWLKIYKKSMQIREITGLQSKITGTQMPEIGFAITSQVAGDWTMVDADTMLVDFKRQLDDPASPIGEVLERFSPFTVDHVPNLDAYGAKIGIRVVRPSEVEEIREINADKAYELQEALEEQGTAQKDGPAHIEGKVFFDMEWAVIHMETKHSAYGKPHWGPALDKLNIFLRKQLLSVDFHKRIKKIFTPENVRWKKEMSGVPALPEIQVFALKSFEKFQNSLY